MLGCDRDAALLQWVAHAREGLSERSIVCMPPLIEQPSNILDVQLLCAATHDGHDGLHGCTSTAAEPEEATPRRPSLHRQSAAAQRQGRRGAARGPRLLGQPGVQLGERLRDVAPLQQRRAVLAHLVEHEVAEELQQVAVACRAARLSQYARRRSAQP